MSVMSPAARLLVVDDDENNRNMFLRRLRKRGYAVELAQGGIEALELIAKHTFDLIILDVMMPEMDGLEVLRRLRAQYSKLQLPILMATACAGSKDEVEALLLGANDYVTKPINYDQLHARIETQLTLRSEFVAMRGQVAAKVQSSDRLEPGAILDGRYRIEARIGQGGYALVYRARQLSTGQLVAIKILRAIRAMHSGSEGVEYARFRQEMQLLGTLRHPAIVRLIDSGSLTLERGAAMFDGPAMTLGEATLADSLSALDTSPVTSSEVPYFVMEFLEGETLDLLLAREGRLPFERVIEMFMPIVEGVSALHRRGIIHRDLKPSNIFLQHGDLRAYQPKVLDFGIAKLLHDRDPSQATVGFVGTPSYMSPEQALSRPDLDGRADQYTLAIMLYECLCGVRPFAGDNYTQVLLLVTTGDFTPLQERCELPPALCQIVDRAMSRDPAQRFETLETFAQALLLASPASIRSRFEARPSPT